MIQMVPQRASKVLHCGHERGLNPKKRSAKVGVCEGGCRFLSGLQVSGCCLADVRLSAAQRRAIKQLELAFIRDRKLLVGWLGVLVNTSACEKPRF